jgi:hypothetical protein
VKAMDGVSIHAVLIRDRWADLLATTPDGARYTYTVSLDFGRMLGAALEAGALDEAVDVPRQKFPFRRDGWPEN